MEVYDKDGNFLGEFIEAEKEKITDTFVPVVANTLLGIDTHPYTQCSSTMR